MNNYKFAVLDPRNVPAAQAANDAIFASGQVYGIEVTVPALAGRCVGNLDPQHTGSNAGIAAIEAALTCELPPEGTVLATIRPDLDSVGAMAVIAILALDDGRQIMEGYNLGLRFASVAKADKFARGEYPGPQPLPTTENPWPTEGAADSTRSLAAIGAAVADFKVSISERVEVMKKWLLTGEEPAQYRAQVERERQDLVRALADGTIKVSVAAEGRIAVVESTHRAATTVGYAKAPVVIALNPAFKAGPGEPYRKFTVCAYSAKHADIKSVLAELATLEPGWGGSPTIGGSPQGISSTLTVEQVVEVVSRHLK